MQYPDLLWTLLATVGGLLLLNGHEKELNKTNWWGVALIFIGFLVQVYYDVRANPLQVIFVTVYLLIFIPLFVWPGWVRKKWLTKT